MKQNKWIKLFVNYESPATSAKVSANKPPRPNAKLFIFQKMTPKKILALMMFFSLLDGEPYSKGFFSFITQNDGYVRPRTDKYYTAGHGLLYVSKEGDYSFLNTFGLTKGETSFSLSLSQAIYTPKAKFDFIPPNNDHPYAGLLSLTFGVHHRGENVLESLGLRIGLSGKLALGEEIQNGVHKAIGRGLANGWDTQIGNEMILNFYYERTYRYSLLKDSPIALDVLPNFEFAFGNANVYAKIDAVFKLGYNLNHSFLAQGVIGENGGLQSGRIYQDGLSFFVFFGAGGAYVVRKMAIDGNLFSNVKRDVHLSPFVGNLQVGIALLSGDFSISYKALYISKQFKEQDGAHFIGSISLAYSF